MSRSASIGWLRGSSLLPITNLQPLEGFVGGRDDRVRKMAPFFAPDKDLPFLVEELDVRTLRFLINRMGGIYELVEASGWVTADMRAAGQVDRWVRRLSSLPDYAALQAMEALATDEALSKWSLFLERARDRQRVIHRDANYQHPNVEQVRQALDDAAPANAADLATLVIDRL